MNVRELKEILEDINEDVQVQGSDGKEFSHVVLYKGTDGENYLEIE